MALEDAGVRPEDGEVVVTGASGGVGSTAVALLHHLGYKVAAVSGREAPMNILKASARSAFLAAMSSPKPARWKNSCGPVPLIPLAIRCWQKCWRR